MPRRSMPSCSQNRSSSMETTAFCMIVGIWLSGTTMRFSSPSMRVISDPSAA